MCGNMLLMDSQKSWLLIGRAKLSSTNGPLFIPFCFCEHMLNCMLLSSRGCPMISPLYWNCILCVPIWILVSLYRSSLRPLSCIYPTLTSMCQSSLPDSQHTRSYRCAAQSAAASRMDPMSGHCVVPPVILCYAFLIHTTTLTPVSL